MTEVQKMVGEGYEDDIIIGYKPKDAPSALRVPFCTFLPRWYKKFKRL